MAASSTPAGTPTDRPSDVRRARRRRVDRLAAAQQGVVSRRQLYAAGITRGEVRANVRAGRWRRVASQSVCVHRGPLDAPALRQAALFEAGPRAYLDGASSLQAAGLVNFTVSRVRVSVPRGARVRRSAEFDIRQTRRFDPDDVVPEPLPRSRNAVAAVRAALWARTDKEAALVLTMAVQQRLVTAEEIGEAMLRVRRDKRRAFVHAVLLDLIGGVRSLGELDVAGECRRRGLPEPSRQLIRRGRGRTYYLDIFWERYGVVVEVDGIHHTWAQNVVADAARHNDLALQAHTVLRLPLLGLRVEPEAFFGQIEQALRNGGWSGVLTRSA